MLNALKFIFKNGETLLFKDFFDKNYEVSIQYIKTLGKHQSDAEDIAITVYTNIFKKIDNLIFESEEKLKIYLYTSCRNEVISRFRKRRNGKNLNFSYDTPIDEIDIEIYVEAEEYVNQWIDIFHKEIELQPSKRRAVATYYYIKRMKPKKISKILEIKPTTVYGHLDDFINYLKSKYKNFPIDCPTFLPISLILFPLLLQ